MWQGFRLLPLFLLQKVKYFVIMNVRYKHTPKYKTHYKGTTVGISLTVVFLFFIVFVVDF